VDCQDAREVLGHRQGRRERGDGALGERQYALASWRAESIRGGVAMRRVWEVAFLATVLLVHGVLSWAEAASKFNTCGLLTQPI
jgi:hypothetical protein